MLSVAGGKLTTYRRIALDVLEELRSDLGLHEIDRRPWPLPGAAGLDRIRLPVEVTPATRSHLSQLYGSLSSEVLAPALDDPSLLEPLSPDAPDIAASAVYAAASEWARNADDVVRRRTTLALRGCATPEVDEQGRGADRGPEAAGARRSRLTRRAHRRPRRSGPGPASEVIYEQASPSERMGACPTMP